MTIPVDADRKRHTLPYSSGPFDLDDVELRSVGSGVPATAHSELCAGVLGPVLFSKTLAQINERVGATDACRLRKQRKTTNQYKSTNQKLLAKCHFFPSANRLSRTGCA